MRYSRILVFSTCVTGRALLISGSGLCQQRAVPKISMYECRAQGWGSDQRRLTAFPGCCKGARDAASYHRNIPQAISSHLAICVRSALCSITICSW